MREEITIERLSYGNAGVGHADDGKTVFVAHGVPGDVVRVERIQEKPRFDSARIVEIIEPSADRVAAACPYCESCGGCPWMHLSYPAQLRAKRENVVGALTHTAKMEREQAEALVGACKGSKRELGFRNKLELSASFDGTRGLQVGFMQEGSNELVRADRCLIAHDAIAKAPKALRGALRYIQGTQDLGIFRVGVRHSLRTRDLEVALWTRPGAFPRKAAATTLQSAVHATSVVRVMADPGKARRIKGVEALSGKGFWEERLLDYGFKTSAPSFFQVNSAQAETLIDEVLTGLELTGTETVADLYAGGGTFSLPLAEHAETVIAVESSSSSVRDLRRNAESNGVYIEIVGGDSAREINGLGDLDALVVDPPRSGLAEGVVESIASIRPGRVAYVSCNPATWARDIVRFTENGYRLVRATPVDLFPQSYHCEIVSILTAEKP